jgi:heptosyltransferase-3
VLGYEKTMGMLVGNSHINEVIESPEHPRWPEYKLLLGRIFRKYDLAIVTQPSDRAHIYGLLAAPKRVGIVSPEPLHHWWKNLLSLHTVELDYWRQHAVVERLRLLEPFSTRSVIVPQLDPPAPLPLEVAAPLICKPYVVIHATPMWRFKRWPSTSWAGLIEYLVLRGHHVVLTGSLSVKDKALNAEILELLSVGARASTLDLAGALNLNQMTTLLVGADRYVGVDTSVTHQAAAVGVRTIALFGPTPPTNFGPWPKGEDRLDRDSPWDLVGEGDVDMARFQVKSNVTIVQGPGRCVPCRKAGCQDKFESHSECLETLSIRDVARLFDHSQKICTQNS